jgi:rare lipoprotein A
MNDAVHQKSRLTQSDRLIRSALIVALIALLAACASGPPRPAPGRDGPEANPPADLARVPDAEPRLEPIRIGGPNKPYDVSGRNYVPLTQDAPFAQRGLASWYGRQFHGRRTASGEVYNMYAMTAAHPTLPIPSYARIRNPANGREVLVRVNDRGPFVAGRIVDLSYTAALKLDLLRNAAPVELQRITFDEIKTGAWRREGDAVVAAVPVPVPATPAVAEVAPRGVAVPAEAVVAVAAVSSENAAVATTPAPSPPASAAAEPPTAPSTAPSPSPLPAPITDAPAARALTGAARGFWVQLGAFRVRAGAEGFQQRVAVEMNWLSPMLAVFNDAAMFRLQAGPYASRDEAGNVAERVRDGLKLVPVIVERR